MHVTAQQMAQQAAQQELNLGDHETRLAMGVIKELIRRMAAMPGQRSIILVSNGFVTLAEHSTEKTEIMDRAIRASVLINALDARGLYTDTPDITRQGTNYRTEMVLHQMERETNRAQSDVLAELAAGTGATFFQNNNDLDAGFARLASAPEYYYLLAFSPQNLKMDGSFHALKVTLKNVKDVSANARTGYYAPRHLENAIETAKREIEEALFSREEMSDIPVELHTQFFKSGEDAARVSLVIKVDVKHLKFRKEDGPQLQRTDGGGGPVRPQWRVRDGQSEEDRDASEGRDGGETPGRRLDHPLQFRCEAGDVFGPAGGQGCRRTVDVGAERRRRDSVLRGVACDSSARCC